MQEGFFCCLPFASCQFRFFPSHLCSEDAPLSTGVHVNGTHKNTPNLQSQMTRGSKHARGVMNMIISHGISSVLCGNGGTLLGIRNDGGGAFSDDWKNLPSSFCSDKKHNYSVITKVM